MLFRRRKVRHNDLQVIIKDAPHSHAHGSIVVIPPSFMKAPFKVSWKRNQVDMTDISLDASGLCASLLTPGDVAITVWDCMENESKINTAVGSHDIATVLSYEVMPASHGHARNGSVRANVINAPPNARYLWNNGVVTTHAFIEYLYCGTYNVCLVAPDGSGIPFIHSCSPAKVKSSFA